MDLFSLFCLQVHKFDISFFKLTKNSPSLSAEVRQLHLFAFNFKHSQPAISPTSEELAFLLLRPPCENVNLDSFAASMMVYLTWYPPLLNTTFTLRSRIFGPSALFLIFVPQKDRHSSPQASSLSAQVMVYLAWYPHRPNISFNILYSPLKLSPPIVPLFFPISLFRQSNGLLGLISSVAVPALIP